MSFLDLKKHTFQNYGIEVKPVKPEDLSSLRRWRNSPYIRDQMIDSTHISTRGQRLWFEGLKNKENELHFVIWTKGTRTGYMNIKRENYHEYDKSVWLGGYIAKSSVNHALLGISFSMIQLDISFDYLKASIAKISIKRNNSRALRFNKVMGYKKVDEKGDYIWFEMTPKDYINAKTRFSKYFKRGFK